MNQKWSIFNRRQHQKTIDPNSPSVVRKKQEEYVRSAALNGFITTLHGQNKRLKLLFYALSGLLFISLILNSLMLLSPI